MKHLKLNLLEGPNLVGTAGHDEFFIREGTTVISGFTPGQDYLWEDSGTRVNDGHLASFKTPAGYVTDGVTFSNSQHTADFAAHTLDYNGDGVMDLQIDTIVNGSIYGSAVLLGIISVPEADIFGG